MIKIGKLIYIKICLLQISTYYYEHKLCSMLIFGKNSYICTVFISTSKTKNISFRNAFMVYIVFFSMASLSFLVYRNFLLVARCR